jgi:hypothetical protein
MYNDMPNDRLFEVDESVARAMREECVDGRMSLLDDLRGGIHARAVISEMQHARNAKHIGEHTAAAGDIEMRLTNVFHGAGFHQLAMQEGTYDCWDDDDFINWRGRRFAETRVKYTPRNAIIQGFAFKGSSRLNPPAI